MACLNNNYTHHGAKYFANLLAQLQVSDILHRKTCLVAGYGAGHEAAFLEETIDTTVFGVDLRIPSIHFRRKFLGTVANLQALPFADGSFDFVFSHHVLEHVSNPQVALSEMYRVLRPSGYLYLSTPNRYRLVGYIGSFDVSVAQKIAWNVKDYVDRLMGRFKNELGSHAGFSQEELDQLLQEYFNSRKWLTRDYLMAKYSPSVPTYLLKLLLSDPLIRFSAPSIHVLCQK